MTRHFYREGKSISYTNESGSRVPQNYEEKFTVASDLSVTNEDYSEGKLSTYDSSIAYKSVDFPISGSLSMVKYEYDKANFKETKKYVGGAVYSVYASNGGKIAKFTTTTTGFAKCSKVSGLSSKYDGMYVSETENSLRGIPIGTYTIKETKVPKGYTKFKDATLTVSETSQVITYYRGKKGADGKLSFVKNTLTQKETTDSGVYKVNDNVKYSAYDYKKTDTDPFSLVIKKVDAETGTVYSV